MSSPNGLICFTNCLLPLEDGGLVEKDLWIDQRRGVILDAQDTFFLRNERPAQTIDLGGNILSPGFLDIQINGAYGFDFSIYEGDDLVYRDGLRHVAEKIVESGVTSYVLPTIVTQEKSLYPKLLSLLRPYSPPSSANILGWHAEGPYLQFAKRGAHAPPFLLTAPEGYKSVEKLYGAENLADAEDWLMNQGVLNEVGVRIITAAPEVEGVMESVSELTKRGIVFSIGHSIATIDLATTAVQNGANLITHLFNAMPQLHHRDPSIIGLLGQVADLSFERPFYEMIVDGIHSHPNSVRLAYSSHPEGCILITDAMKILDPNLHDGVHEWRDGKRFVKEGDKLYLEGTNTLAGSVVTLDKCVRNFSRFTGCSLGEAIKCATYNPAKCLGIENRKGTLRSGADADFVVLDRKGNVLNTWVKGKQVWSKGL
ncbi:carbohydrate esterase family 9 protein [Piloderma croceum F 1598]|uniref:N-acetylglucosamine-6-phosphate deacetylase n=1 Tax=Piloderma croceum (strain F 1598) TaxID=765440 RepID=A0A0C3FSI1_PILCF|nr:carbohydrate esterase family 9 protein [Piloderma croceum F 1598]